MGDSDSFGTNKSSYEDRVPQSDYCARHSTFLGYLMIIVNESVAILLRELGMTEDRDFVVSRPIPRGWDAKAAVRSLTKKS